MAEEAKQPKPLKERTDRMLSRKERDCLDLFELGYTPSEIDRKLSWIQGTARTVITAIWRDEVEKMKEHLWDS